MTCGLALMMGLLIAGSLPADAQGRRAPSGGGQGGTAVARPAPPVAQPRPPSQGHPGGGGYYGGRYHGGYPGGYYRGPHYYYGIGYYGGAYPWFWGLGWGWGWGWGWWGAPGYYPPYPYYGWGYPTASVRIQVEPKTAEVFVDGHLAGIVDDFDGTFQRLSVEPGGREITIYKEGFHPYRERLYLRADKGTTIKQALQPLGPGEPNEPRPVPPPPVAQEPPAWAPPRPTAEAPPEPQAVTGVPTASNFGQVAIRVQPADAEVFIDGEPWRGPAGADRLTVHLRPGVHRVEIRKEGFDPFVTSVEIKNGETTVLNVSLGRLTGV